MIAQVDEQHAAVIADTMAPAGKPSLLVGIGEGQGTAGVRAIAGGFGGSRHAQAPSLKAFAGKGVCGRCWLHVFTIAP